MKRYFILILVLSTSAVVNAQFKNQTVKADSLLKMFQVMKPFEVLDKIKIIFYMDFKTLYDDAALKPYLLKLLNRDEYFQYKVKKETNEIASDTSFINSELKYRLNKQRRKDFLDTILNDPILYNCYKDSIIQEGTNRFIKSYNKISYHIPYEIIRFHSFLAYPESYSIIKQRWEETGKGSDRDNLYFLLLIRMGDPEARKLYDDKINLFVKTNGKSSDLSEIYSEMMDINCSYAINKKLELLKVDQIYKPFENDPGKPFKCFIIKLLFRELKYKKIELDGSVKETDLCGMLKKHLPQIKAAAQKLIEKYKEEEYYWMKNMPFYKN